MKAFKFTILTPWTLLPENVPEAECEDKPADEFAQLLCRRTDEELHRRTFWPRTRGESFIKTSFDEFEEKFLRKSEYAVIVLSGTHTSCLDSIYPRLLVFLTVRKTWASRFLLVFLGDPVSGRRFDQKMLTHPPLVFHGNVAEGWRTDNHEWEQLLGVLKKEYIPKSMESLKASGSEVSGTKSEKYYYTPFGSRWLSVSDLRGKPFAVKITERGTHMSWQDVRVDSETWIQTSNQTHRSSAYCDSLSSEPALSQSLPVPELPIKRRRAGSDSKAYSETAVYSYQYEGKAYSADFQSSHDLFSSSLRIESDISPYVRRRLAVAHHRRPRSACQLKIEEKEEDFFTHEIKRNPAYNTSEQMCLPKCILSCQCSRHLAEPSQEEKFKESLDNPSVRDGSSKSLKKSFLQTLNLGRTRRSEPEERHSERTASIPTLKSLKVKAQTFFHPKGKRRGRNVADSLKQAADSLSIFPTDVVSSEPTSGNRTDAVSAESCPDMYTNLSSHTRKPVVQEHYLEYELHRTQPMHFAQSTPYPQTDEKQGRGPTSYPPGHQLFQISHQQLSVPFTVNADDFQSNCSTLRIDSGLASLSPAPSDYANESAEQMWTPASNLSSPDVRRDRKNKADHSQLSATYYMLPSTTPCIRRFVKPNQLESIVYKSEITISKGTGPVSVEDRSHTEEERSNQKTLPSATVKQKQKTTMTVPQISSEQTKMPGDSEDLTSQLYQYKGSLPIVIIKTPEKSANISVERKCITTINNKHPNTSETQTEEQKSTHQKQDTPNKQNTGMKTPDEQQQTTTENTEKQHEEQQETQSQYKQKRKNYKNQTKQITFRTHEHEDQRVCAGEVDEPLGSLATKSETKSIVHGDLGDDNVMISEAAKRGVGAAESSVPGTGKLEDSVDHDAGPGGVSAPFGFGDFAASPLAPEFEQSASVGVSDDSVSAGRVAPETASGLNLDDLSNVPHSADDLHKPESSADETIECRLLPGLEWTVASTDAGTDGVGLDVDGDLKMVVTESGSRPLIGDVKTVGEVTEDGEMHETGSILPEHEDQRVCAGEVDEPLGSLATKSETKSIVHGDLGADGVGCGVSGLSDLIAVSQRIPRSDVAVHSLHAGNMSLGSCSISPSFQVVGSVARSNFLRGVYTPTSFDPVISDSLSGVSEIGDSLGQLTTLRSSEVNVGTFRSSSLSQGYFSMAADSMLHRCHSSPSLFTRSDASCLTDVPVADGASDLSLSSRRSSCASCGAAIGSSSLEFSPVVCSHLVSCRRLSDGECLVNAEVSPFVSLGSSASVPLPLSFLMSDVRPSLADPSSSSMHRDFSGSGPQRSLVVDTEAVGPVDAGLLVSRYPLNSHLELTTVEGDVHHWYFVDGLQYVWTTMTQPLSGMHRISWDFGICTSIFHFVTAYIPRHIYWFYTAVFSSREHFYNAMAGQRTLTWQHIERRVRDPYYVVAAFFGMTLASPYIRHWPAILGMMPSLSDFRPFNPLFWVERPILFYLDRITHQFRRGLPWNNQVLITSFPHYPWCLANPKP